MTALIGDIIERLESIKSRSSRGNERIKPKLNHSYLFRSPGNFDCMPDYPREDTHATRDLICPSKFPKHTHIKPSCGVVAAELSKGNFNKFRS